MEIQKIIEYEDQLRSYMNTLIDVLGTPNMSTHRKQLKENLAIAIVCQDVLDSYDLKLKELKYVLDNGAKNVNFCCVVCGKRLKDIRKTYCSKDCFIKSKSKSKENELKAPSHIEKYKSEIIKDEDLDVSYIEKNRDDIVSYMESIQDATGGHNVSSHKYQLKLGNSGAVLTEEVLRKLGINLKELKYLLSVKRLTTDEFFCKTCGKRLNHVFHDYCSIKCMRNSETVKEKTRKTCLEKYGVDNVGKAKEIKEKIVETNKKRYGVEHTFQAEEVKKKIAETFIERYGTSELITTFRL